MTESERAAKIQSYIETYVLENTASKALAKKALINTGVYTKDGKLKVEFGGASKAKDAA
jgi:hypothetical protein